MKRYSSFDRGESQLFLEFTRFGSKTRTWVDPIPFDSATSKSAPFLKDYIEDSKSGTLVVKGPVVGACGLRYHLI